MKLPVSNGDEWRVLRRTTFLEGGASTTMNGFLDVCFVEPSLVKTMSPGCSDGDCWCFPFGARDFAK